MVIASPVQFRSSKLLGKRSRRNRPTIAPAFKVLAAYIHGLIQSYGKFLSVGDDFEKLEAEVRAGLNGFRTYLRAGDAETEFTTMLAEVGIQITDSQAKDNLNDPQYAIFERSASEADVAFKAAEFARRFRSQTGTTVTVKTLDAAMTRLEQSHADFVHQFRMLGKQDKAQKADLVKRAKDVLFALLVMLSNWMWARRGAAYGWTSVRVGLHGFQ